MECVNVDITVEPTAPAPPKIVHHDIPEKYRRIMQKYKYNWRLSTLAEPREKTVKFEQKPSLVTAPRKEVKLSPEMLFYADHLSRAPIRIMSYNRSAFKHIMDKKFVKRMTKKIDLSWNSIYNYYKLKEHDKALRKRRMLRLKKAKKSKADIEKHMALIFNELSKPKPVLKPTYKKTPRAKLDDLYRMDVLAIPKKYVVHPPKTLEVNPAALTYEASDNVKFLAKLPKRWLNLPKPLEPGKVKKSALLYKISPRVEEIALPKKRISATIDEGEDRWIISKNALKYKATERILELAKPVERD